MLAPTIYLIVLLTKNILALTPYTYARRATYAGTHKNAPELKPDGHSIGTNHSKLRRKSDCVIRIGGANILV